jgi:hypothetical protein
MTSTGKGCLPEKRFLLPFFPKASGYVVWQVS